MDSTPKGNFSLQDTATGFYQRHPIISHIILIILTAIFLCLLGLLFLNIWTEHGKTAMTPNIKGMSYSLASQILQQEGMEIEISDSIYDSSVAPGIVMETWPRANTTVKPGRKVFVTVNAFSPRKVSIGTPLQDISSRQAISYLRGLGIKNIRTEYVTGQFDDLVKGVYLDGHQLVPGSTISETATITVVVTRAPSQEAIADSTSVTTPVNP